MKYTKYLFLAVFMVIFIAIIPSFSNAAKVNVDKVKSIKLVSNSDSSLKIKWKKVKKATGYKIYVYNSKKKKYEYKYHTKYNNYELKNLKSAENFKLKICAYRKVKNKKYYGKNSSVFSATTKPSKVKKLSVKGVVENTISLQWKSVARATSYKVYVYNDTNKKYEEKLSTTSNSASISNLVDLKEYKVKVRAIKRFNKKNYYGEYSSIITADTKLSKPKGLRTNSASLDSITIDWDYNAKALGYKVYMYNSSSKEFEYLGETQEHTYTITDLKYATGYSFKVLAFSEYKNNKVYSAYSDVFDTATYPKCIENLEFGKITTSSMELKWNKVDKVTGYAIYMYNESTQGYKLYQTTTKNSITVTDLKAAKFYKFYIKTYIEINKKQYYSSASSVISAKTNSTVYAKAGIDVSKHQGTINWDLVKGMGLDFAILRLGWIGNENNNGYNHYLDEKFEEYYNECKRLNIPVGVYVYCYSKNAKAAKEGAKWTVQELGDKKLDLPVFIDMEDSSIVKAGKKELTKICVEFNNIISKANYTPGIYANRNWFDNHLDLELRNKYTCWIAHYTSSPKINYEDTFPIWQYSSTGKLSGINGNVDLDIMYIKDEGAE